MISEDAMTDVALTRAGQPRKNAPGAGRPHKLTPEVMGKILSAASACQRVQVACELAGVSRSVFYAALRTAARAEEHLRNGGSESDLTDYDRASMQFSTELQQALAKAESVAVDSIRRAGSEVAVERKTTTKCVGLDADHQPVFATETTVTERAPDWRARAWWLERGPTLGGKYAARQHVEVTGADGGPPAIEFAAQLEEIAGMIKGDVIPADSRAIDE